MEMLTITEETTGSTNVGSTVVHCQGTRNTGVSGIVGILALLDIISE